MEGPPNFRSSELGMSLVIQGRVRVMGKKGEDEFKGKVKDQTIQGPIRTC